MRTHQDLDDAVARIEREMIADSERRACRLKHRLEAWRVFTLCFFYGVALFVAGMAFRLWMLP